jgi:signal transduction histidine kinase
MTPLIYRIVWAASVVTFAFGALAFSTLALFYWRQRRTQYTGASRVFPVFTLVCAAAFLLNLAQQADPRLDWLSPILDLVTGMIPALLVHLVVQEELGGPQGFLIVVYGLAAVTAGAVAASDAGWAFESWSDRLESAPAAVLGFSALFALFAQLKSRRALTPPERRYRLWIRALLIALVVTTAATGWPATPLFSLIPDYILLALFCVTLYYKERLVFFDILLKRGAYFAAGSIAFALYFAYMVPPSIVQEALFATLWLAGPWIYARLSGAIDRVWLRRRYSAAEAERHFVAAVQTAESETDLRTRAAASLEQIFEAPATVQLDDSSTPIVKLGDRANGIPHLSDDLRLLQSLTRTLGVVLENVRFREREEQLRLLAGRAELKALRAQINPHFLFNALNAIAGLIHTNAAAAEDTVEQLAEVFRYTLRKSEHEWVRLDEEIEFVAAYLRIEQARFGDRLAVEIQIDPAARAIQVPAMCIQPLVENAIKHGTSQVEGQGRVSVHATLADGLLTIEVTDNGPGFPPGPRPLAPGPSSGPHALANVADRLSGYYGSSASLAWTNDSGARVSLRIPHASSDRR